MKLCLCVSGTSSANLEGFLAPNESFIQSLIFIFFFVECFFLNLYFSLSLFNNSRASHVHMRDFKTAPADDYLHYRYCFINE